MDQELTDYKKIHTEIFEGMESILNKYNISPHCFLFVLNENNKSAHEEIMNLLKKYLLDAVDRQEIMTINRDVSIDIYQTMFNNPDNKEENSNKYQICIIISNYINKFYNGFFFIRDNGIQLKNKEFFQLPHLDIDDYEKIEENYNYIKNKIGNPSLHPNMELCLLILPNGDCYFSPIADHLVLAYWLNVNGINLEDAIRFESSKQFYDFGFSSLFNYKFTENKTEEKYINLTDAQAKTIVAMYKTLQSKWLFLKPLEHELLKCDGFGFAKNDYNPDLADININKIAQYARGELTKVKYLREVKDLHEKLFKQAPPSQPTSPQDEGMTQ